ncbi:MAG: hypothetical protein ACOVOD_04495 [Rhodoferax sp.]
MHSKLATLVLCTSPLLASAGQWEICDYAIQIDSSAPSGVRATVKEAALKNPELCEKVGASLTFAPESEDYQSVLPRKRWPKVGATTALRYRQLTGFCKNDGDTKPCTIRHYSIFPHR